MTSCDLVTSQKIEISNRLYTTERAPEDAAIFPTCVLAAMYLSVPGATNTELVGVHLWPESLYGVKGPEQVANFSPPYNSEVNNS